MGVWEASGDSAAAEVCTDLVVNVWVRGCTGRHQPCRHLASTPFWAPIGPF